VRDASIRVRPDVLAAVEQHARRAAPAECCGLLVARSGRIDEAVAVDNRASDPHRRYEIDPRDYLTLIRRCRGTGALVVGAYHSHPRSAPEPSATDRDEAFSGFLYVIAGTTADAGEWAIRAYQLVDGNFQPVALVPAPEEPTT
jgi:proteasome lid subunit RPN8/RPN11